MMPGNEDELPTMVNDGDRAAMDRLAVYSIRLLAADMVDKAGSGHLGAPFGCAPLANALWSDIMKFSPRKRWVNRDRFILSAGHASALQYVMLHLIGCGCGGPFEVTMDALKQFRQAGSSTPGHPEFRMTSGVEVTTGPLGQGFANAVGIAIAEAHMSARFNRQGFPLFDHYTYVLAGDGCMMEGVCSEAASLAGHLELHKLIVFYDDNKTTIDGKTDLAFSEDVGARFAAYKWNVVYIPNGDLTDSAIFIEAVRKAKSQTKKPTIIIMTTTIGCGAGEGMEGTAKAHGNKLPNLEQFREKWASPKGLCQGDDVDVKVATMVRQELDELLGLNAAQLCKDVLKDDARVLPHFHLLHPVVKKFRAVGTRGDSMADAWEQMLLKYYDTFQELEPMLVEDLRNRMQGIYLAGDWQSSVHEYLAKEKQVIDTTLRSLSNLSTKEETRESEFKYKAGRVYVADVLKCMVELNHSLIGGSGDVASSCGGHFPNIQGHFLPASYSDRYPGASYAGRYIHFGIREHAGVAVLNGIASYACLIPYSTLFTVFYQYALPAIRMASISKFPVLYIGTHDSIDVGEDGPTHQPVEVLPQLRAMPNLLVIRPANLEEIVGSFEVFGAQYAAPRGIHQYIDPKPLIRRPVFLMTSRGELGLPYKGNTAVTGQEGVKKGAYVLHECFDEPVVQKTTNGISHEGATHVEPLPDIVLIASGQDVALIMRAKEILLQLSLKFNTQLQAGLAGLPPCLSAQAPQILKVRVVSMPCWELFDEQDQDYQDAVLLSNFSNVLRIYVEKAATKNTGHDKYAHISVLMPSYGLSGKGADVERKLEFTPDFIAAKVWSKWMERGRSTSQAGVKADMDMSTWVSYLGSRV
mmetsp:Transcript_15519/g.30018  ORF Transcript_15519/g.30018 Transcript_15519/m.30018 type:complete len:864 (+) Transcript_15519:60-2651(+)